MHAPAARRRRQRAAAGAARIPGAASAAGAAAAADRGRLGAAGAAGACVAPRALRAPPAPSAPSAPRTPLAPRARPQRECLFRIFETRKWNAVLLSDVAYPTAGVYEYRTAHQVWTVVTQGRVAIALDAVWTRRWRDSGAVQYSAGGARSGRSCRGISVFLGAAVDQDGSEVSRRFMEFCVEQVKWLDRALDHGGISKLDWFRLAQEKRRAHRDLVSRAASGAWQARHGPDLPPPDGWLMYTDGSGQAQGPVEDWDTCKKCGEVLPARLMRNHFRRCQRPPAQWVIPPGSDKCRKCGKLLPEGQRQHPAQGGQFSDAPQVGRPDRLRSVSVGSRFDTLERTVRRVAAGSDEMNKHRNIVVANAPSVQAFFKEKVIDPPGNKYGEFKQGMGAKLIEDLATQMGLPTDLSGVGTCTNPILQAALRPLTELRDALATRGGITNVHANPKKGAIKDMDAAIRLSGGYPCRNHAGKGKGLGKGKGRGKQPEAPAWDLNDPADYQAAIRDAMPEAAKMRAQSTLLQDEWEAEVKPHQTLDSTGVVAVVPKDALPMVLERVGYTAKATVAIVTQNPDDLGLRGYPRARVDCQLSVADAGGERTTARVTRWLVQLGFGEQVKKRAIGAAVDIGFHMVKMVAKLSSRHEWSTGPQLAAILVQHLVANDISEGALDSSVTREDGTATFLVHSTLVAKVLRLSGKSGIFLKVHKDQREHEAMELVWLPDLTELAVALQMANDDRVHGLAEKGNGRLALRCKTVPDAAAIVQKEGLQDTPDVPRWKVTGVPLAAGTHGLYDMLIAQDWKVADVIFMDAKQAIFHATNKGRTAPLQFLDQEQPVPIVFKAVNAAARALAKDDAQAQRAGRAAAGGPSAAFNFVRSVVPAFPGTPPALGAAPAAQSRAPAQQPVSPRGQRRPTEQSTGLTPPEQKQKTGDPMQQER
ncbi:unnamed protein product [Prorocentrum cordatum]|uniref:Uncharacterized protein n=1 Tax=Prorocentrum cordatum TaxID=2364126 RepID=A0ABN9U393_9DINO|nr:unnamed protein product [Polarella glacialis]